MSRGMVSWGMGDGCMISRGRGSRCMICWFRRSISVYLRSIRGFRCRDIGRFRSRGIGRFRSRGRGIGRCWGWDISRSWGNCYCIRILSSSCIIIIDR